MKSRKVTVFLLIAIAVNTILIGCSDTKVSEKSKIDKALQEFEAALDIGQYEDVIEARDAVLAITYNPPTNMFWPIAVWGAVEYYIFKEHVVSIDGVNATIILTYTVMYLESGESSERQKTFSMKKFGDEWRVNLAEFVGLD